MTKNDFVAKNTELSVTVKTERSNPIDGTNDRLNKQSKK